jgi:hypothetical protein
MSYLECKGNSLAGSLEPIIFSNPIRLSNRLKEVKGLNYFAESKILNFVTSR